MELYLKNKTKIHNFSQFQIILGILGNYSLVSSSSSHVQYRHDLNLTK